MTERITEFKGDWEVFSNFSHHPVMLDGVYYSTAEHAYQSRKCVYVRDLRAIMDCSTPAQAKRLGGKILMAEDFEEKKVGYMYEIIRAKFYYGYDKELWPLWWTLTTTDDAELVEGNVWHDNFWGQCSCSHCLNFNTTGQNMLGKILMKVRGEIDGENRR